MSQMDHLTIIRSPGQRLTKLHTPTSTEGYGSVTYVQSRQVPMFGVHDLHRILTGLEGKKDCAVIRGSRRAATLDLDKVRRRFHRRPDTDDPPGFDPQPRLWVCIDIDKLPTPAHIDPATDPEAAVLYAISKLPQWFHGVTCHWQWSSSAGLGGEWPILKLHLWFWLDHAVDGPSWRAWARAWGVVDPMLYNPVQPHYTATPVFGGGLVDHVERRSGLLEQDWEMVSVPEEVWRWTEIQEQERLRRRLEEANRPLTYTVSSARQRARADGLVSKVRQDLLSVPIGTGAHDAALRAAGTLANMVTWGWVDESVARSVLDCSPIADAPRRDGELDSVWKWTLEQARLNPSPEPDPGPERRSLRRPPAPPPAGTPVAGQGTGGAGEHKDASTPPPPAGGGGDEGEDGEPPEDPNPRPDVDGYRDNDNILWRQMSDGTWIGLEFGRQVARHKIARDSIKPEVKVFGRDITPISHTVDVVTGRPGVRISYYDPAGRRRGEVVEAATWTARTYAQKEGERLANEGVQVAPDAGAWLVLHLGRWAQATHGLHTEEIIASAGWHETGSDRWAHAWPTGDVAGASWVWTGRDLDTRESLNVWRAGIKDLDLTDGQYFLLGAALAGALVRPLERSSFIVHVGGDSGTGKTVSTSLAGSVWHGYRDRLMWDDTHLSTTRMLSEYSGGGVVIDDVRNATPKKVGYLVHQISQNRERNRLHTDGSGMRLGVTWHLAALSSGEKTLRKFLGDELQGGHLVRAIDLEVEPGQAHLTRDAVHADRCEQFYLRHYGAAGPAWAAWLAGLEVEDWQGMRHHLREMHAHHSAHLEHGDVEGGRLLRHIVLCGLALRLAHEARIIDLDDPDAQVERSVRWVMERIGRERRGARTPSERFWQTLQQLQLTDPSLFPSESQYIDATHVRKVLGITRTSPGGQGGVVYTTEPMLDENPRLQKLACATRSFMAWGRRHGLVSVPPEADQKGRMRLGGKRWRWWCLHLDRDPEDVTS